MTLTSSKQYNNAMEKFLIFSGYLSFRNFSAVEAKVFNDLFDAIDAYEKKNKISLRQTIGFCRKV